MDNQVDISKLFGVQFFNEDGFPRTLDEIWNDIAEEWDKLPEERKDEIIRAFNKGDEQL